MDRQSVLRDRGNRIRIAREAARLSQAKLAEILGIERKTLMKIEGGERDLDSYGYDLVVEATGQSGEFLRGETNQLTMVNGDMRPYRGWELDLTDHSALVTTAA